MARAGAHSRRQGVDYCEVATITAPFAQAICDTPIARSMESGYYIEPWAMPIVVAVGIIGVLVVLWLTKGVGYLHGMFGKVMLVGRFEGAAMVPAPMPSVVAAGTLGDPPAGTR